MYRLLICDDESVERQMLRLLLNWRALGFEYVGEASNGVEALRLIRELAPNLVLMDIRMPGLSGLEALEQAASPGRQFACILISGYADFEYARAGLRNPMVYDYLLKPVETEALTASVLRLRSELEACKGGRQKGAGNEAQPALKTIYETPFHLLDAQSLRSLLDQEYGKTIRLGDLARAFNVSDSHLSACIKQKLGISFSNYILNKRMEKAAELLRGTKLEILEVSEKVGFTDYFYFLRIFKRTYGLSPGRYRRQRNGPA